MKPDLLNNEEILDLAKGFGFDSLILILAIAGIIFGFFYLIKNYIFPLVESEKVLAKSKILTFRIEVLVWSVFALLVLVFSISVSPFVTVIICAILIGLGFTFWRDFFPGLIVRVANQFHIGDTVSFSNVNGEIVHVGYISIQIKSQEGELVYIPFHKMMNEIRVKQQAKGKLLSQKVIIQEANKTLTVAQIEDWVKHCPWVVQQDSLSCQKIENGKFAITVFAVDQFSLVKAQKYLHQKALE